MGRRPLDLHPEPPYQDQGVWKWKIGGLLQHAPYPFKTLTGVNGALAYIDQNFFTTTNTLPWPNPDHPTKKIHWVLIHCRPGLYGPVGASLPAIDVLTGLPFNGEVWPARVRNRVSLQGTSALDTIFDARGQTTAILEINEPQSLVSTSHDSSFIDSFSIRGARAHAANPPTTPPDGAGAGVYIHSYVSDPNYVEAVYHVSVSNCFIYDNTVGIGVNGVSRNGSFTHGHRGKIVNNTIAWNRCGVWQGRFPTFPTQFDNWHLTVFLNNIFDSGSPPGYIAGVSGFEGIENVAREVDQVGADFLTTRIDFNAWEYVPTAPYTYVNTGAVIASNWPAAKWTSIPSLTIPPRVQIQAYTKGPMGRPGSLYVCDILRRAPPQAAPPGYDYARGDFRLAPNVSVDGGSPGTMLPPIRNPLVNAGLEPFTMSPPPPQGPSILPIRFAPGNGMTINTPPGLPPGAEAAPAHAWDWDGEGFGNLRVFARAGFAVGTFSINNPTYPTVQTMIDLGADEMGPLIMGGCVPGTRMFYAHQVPGQTGFYDQTAIVFFDLIDLAPSYPRPIANVLAGGRLDQSQPPVAPLPPEAYHWFKHKTVGADANHGNFTDIPIPFYDSTTGDPARYLLMYPPFSQFEPITRELECDFGGMLLPDKCPRWLGDFMLSYPGPYSRDEYGSNTWYGHPALPPPPMAFSRDNPAIYHNIGGEPHNLFGYQSTQVVDCTLHPPGSLLAGTTYVDPAYPVLTPFGPFSPCTGGANYTVGPWGYGDWGAGCPDRAPYSPVLDSLGVRYNCQGLGTNLQTFLTITSASIPGGSSATRQPTLNKLPAPYSAANAQAFPGKLWRTEWRSR